MLNLLSKWCQLHEKIDAGESNKSPNSTKSHPISFNKQFYDSNDPVK